VFHVLFSNWGTMSAFGHMVDRYVLNTASSFMPDAFNQSGHLARSYIPMWAKSAVFHRDKSRCVLCQTDLSRLFSEQAETHYDHISPLACGGMNCVTKLQLTCSKCNLAKGARSSSTSREYETWYDYDYLCEFLSSAMWPVRLRFNEMTENMTVRVPPASPASLSTRLELPNGGWLTYKIIITMDQKPNMHFRLLEWAAE